uniref:Ig-like domain-containing protein n=1 Tax=Strongyloides stercoralis TaxID=6248 RepID=A0AAF5DKC0_STRER
MLVNNILYVIILVYFTNNSIIYGCPSQMNNDCYSGFISETQNVQQIDTITCKADLKQNWCTVVYSPQTQESIPQCGDLLGEIQDSGCKTVKKMDGSDCLFCCCKGTLCNDPSVFLNIASNRHLYLPNNILTIFIFSITVAILANWGDHLQDVGAPNYSCDPVLFKKSASVPKSVHSLRPADIKHVMALGDSLTAANGAGAEDPISILLQYRGLAFLAGGDKGLEKHITIPNILKKYNSELFGYSLGIGSPDVWPVSFLNAAVPGAVASDLLGQARDLVHKLKSHPNIIDMKEDWKLLNIFIGGNDACHFCNHPQDSPKTFADQIGEAIQFIKDNVPRVIVSLTGMLHLELVRQIDRNEFFCQALHVDECHCESDSDYTSAQISKLCNAMQDAEAELMTSGRFDTTDDFTVVVQPFFKNSTEPPRFANGTVDISFFAPDCFHFSQKGHAIVASHLWKNMLEPVGKKTEHIELGVPSLPLSCPDKTCPFIRTIKNSADCSKYYTPPAN